MCGGGRTARTRRSEPSAARTRRLSLAQRELAPVRCATLAELHFELVGQRSTGEYDDVWFAGSFDMPNDNPASFVSYSTHDAATCWSSTCVCVEIQMTTTKEIWSRLRNRRYTRGDEESASQPAAETHGARPQTAGETPGGSLERRRHRALHCTPCLLAP